jgi:hypothetical protein
MIVQGMFNRAGSDTFLPSQRGRDIIKTQKGFCLMKVEYKDFLM